MMHYQTIILIHDCLSTCFHCSGSGEGMADRSNCTLCGGTGILCDYGTYEVAFDVEWKNSDLSDLEITPYPVCEVCGYNFYKGIIEEILHNRKNKMSQINKIMEID